MCQLLIFYLQGRDEYFPTNVIVNKYLFNFVNLNEVEMKSILENKESRFSIKRNKPKDFYKTIFHFSLEIIYFYAHVYFLGGPEIK